jgi:hypothetical protein
MRYVKKQTSENMQLDVSISAPSNKKKSTGKKNPSDKGRIE